MESVCDHSPLQRKEKTMKAKFACTFALATMCLLPVIGHSANNDADADRSQPKAFVKDSVITTKVKTKLAGEHMGSLVKIHVDTDADGVVYLRGTAPTKADIDKAVSLASQTEGVKSVVNEVTVKADD